MSIYIETDRLIIRELLPEDDKGMFELDTDPEVHKYVGNKPVKTIEECRSVIDFVRQQYVDNGIGRWAVIEKESGDFIGWTGFKLMREPVNNFVNHYDFGYRFIKRKWGQGLATESGIAVLRYGIKELGLKNIYAMTNVGNAASRHLLEKLGFRFIEIFNYDTGKANDWQQQNEPTTWFKLDNTE